ncbi:Unknown protein, partial [Striga hermonthica]
KSVGELLVGFQNKKFRFISQLCILVAIRISISQCKMFYFECNCKKRALIFMSRQGVTVGIRGRFCVSEIFIRQKVFRKPEHVTLTPRRLPVYKSQKSGLPWRLEIRAIKPGIPWRLEAETGAVQFQKVTTFRVSKSGILPVRYSEFSWQSLKSVIYSVLAGPVNTGAALHSTKSWVNVDDLKAIRRKADRDAYRTERAHGHVRQSQQAHWQRPHTQQCVRVASAPQSVTNYRRYVRGRTSARQHARQRAASPSAYTTARHTPSSVSSDASTHASSISCTLASNRGIPCRKGKSPFLESYMLKRFRTVSMYVDWDRHNFLFSQSRITLIPRTCPTSPKSFISNCLDNHTFTSDNIFTLFPMRRISSTYSTRNTTTFPSLSCTHILVPKKELQELKTQIQELLKLGFIRPS